MKLFKLFDCEKLLTDCAEWVERVEKGKKVEVRKIMMRTYESKEVIDMYLRETAPTEWAMIYHDKDTNNHGEPVAPHWHVVCHWRKPASATYLKWLSKVFTDTEQTLVQSPINLRGATEYLWHANSPDKYQYSKDDVISFGLDRLLETKLQGDRKDNATFIEDLQTLTRYELGIKYGKDYMKNFRRYADFVGDVQFQDCQSSVARLAHAWGQLKEFDSKDHCWSLRKGAINVIGTALDKIERLVGSQELAPAYAIESFATAICEAINLLCKIPDEYKENTDD